MTSVRVLVLLTVVSCIHAVAVDRTKRQSNSIDASSVFTSQATACPSMTSLCRNCTCGQEVAQSVANQCVSLGCCRPLALANAVCPNNAQPLQALVGATQVTVGCCPFTACSNGYYCAYSKTNNAWVCCSQGGGFIPPITQPPFPSTAVCRNGARPQGPCVGGSLCQVGFTCETVSNGQRQCCASTGPNPPVTNPPSGVDREFELLMNTMLDDYNRALSSKEYGCPRGTAVIYDYTRPRELPLICNKKTAEGRDGFCPPGQGFQDQPAYHQTDAIQHMRNIIFVVEAMMSKRDNDLAFIVHQLEYSRTCPVWPGRCRDCICNTNLGPHDACARMGCCRALYAETVSCPNDGKALTTRSLYSRDELVAVGCCPFSRCASGHYCAYSQANNAWLCCAGGAHQQQIVPLTIPMPTPASKPELEIRSGDHTLPSTPGYQQSTCRSGHKPVGPCVSLLCPDGYTCEMAPNTLQDVCCADAPHGEPLPSVIEQDIHTHKHAMTLDEFGCPDGTSAVIYESTIAGIKLPLVCRKRGAPETTESGWCPSGSKCVLSDGRNPTYRHYSICCRWNAM